MRESAAFDEPNDRLMFQALLYAGGELEAPDAEAFERRLAEDQAAREALAAAVRLSLTVDGRPSAEPDPAYRAQVVERLRPRRPLWQRLLARRSYRGHPAVWGLLGAAAAVLLLIGSGWSPPAAPPSQAVAPPAARPADDVHPAETDEPPTPEAAAIWATLSGKEHVVKAHGEEARRKARTQERLRLVEYYNRQPSDPGMH
jgi:anti-sigma factor RsiW